jgi:structure-specific endonuclease subunit SLX1
LDLQHTNLTAVPPSITALTNLHTLSLEHTLNDAELPTTAALIAQLPSLQQLHLSYGMVAACTPLLTRPPHLHTLDLTNFNLSQAMSAGLTALTGLRALSLQELDDAVLPDSLSCLTGLQTLTIGNWDNFTALPEDVITALTGLTTLSIRDCHYLLHLPQAIAGLTNLQELHLTSCYSLSGGGDADVTAVLQSQGCRVRRR